MRSTKKKWKALALGLIAALLVGGVGVPSSSYADTTSMDVEDSGTYKGFEDLSDLGGADAYTSDDLITRIFYVLPSGSSDKANADIVYCFNAKNQTPVSDADSTTGITYKKISNVSAAKFYSSATTPRLSADALRKKIISIGLNGYPNNYSGFGTGLKAVQFRVVTQLAIWYYTDTYDKTGSFYSTQYGKLSEAQKQAYQKLISTDLPDSVVAEADGTGFLNLYTTTEKYNSSDGNIVNKAYQNLLSVGKASSTVSVSKPNMSLTLKKEYSGDDGDTVTDDFTFKVKFTIGNDNNHYNLTTDEKSKIKVDNAAASFDGEEITITLKKGESAVISGLPTNYNYEITEEAKTDYAVDSIVPSWQSTAGGALIKNTTAGSITGYFVNQENITVTYTNKKATTTTNTPSPSPSGSESPSTTPSTTPTGSESPSTTPTGSSTPSTTPTGSESPSTTPTDSSTPSTTPETSTSPSPTPTPGPGVTITPDPDDDKTFTVTIPEDETDVVVTIPVDLGPEDGTVTVKITNPEDESREEKVNYSDGAVEVTLDEDSVVEILDDFVPLASAADLDMTEEADTSDVPKTGDYLYTLFWMELACVSFVAMTALVVIAKKKRRYINR